MCSHSAIAALGLLALSAGIAAAGPCTPGLNFFPTAEEIGEPQRVNNRTCQGKEVCNFPSVWQESNQTEYTSKVDTSLSNGPFKVAFKQYGNEQPRLFFTPVSRFLVAGEDISECAAPATARRLLQAEGVIVTAPGHWSYVVSYDGAAAVPGELLADGQSGQLDPEKLAQDGDHCAKITITVSGAKFEPASAAIPSQFTSTQTVCWYKISTQATAKFEFDMCTKQMFTVSVSGIWPLAQNMTQSGSNVIVDGKQALLLRPVIHLFGQKNRSLDGTVLTDLEFDTLNNPVNYINKYIVLPTNFTKTDVLSFVLDQDSLDEGYYKLSAKVALVSEYPDLVDLEGENPILQVDAYGENVRGFTEYLGVTIVNETSMVGVQKSKTTISQISSDKVNKAIQQGEPIKFTWKFAGIGSERCYHDDVEIPDCKSGVVVHAKDVSNGDTTHTFRVLFTDVCGNTKDAQYSYTQTGVTTVSKIDYVPVVNGNIAVVSGTMRLPHAGNRAVAAGSLSFLVTLGMSLLGYLTMAAML